MKITSVILTFLATITFYYTLYDRKVRKQAPTETGAAGVIDDGAEGKSDVSV